jgi:hypothetical protein
MIKASIKYDEIWDSLVFRARDELEDCSLEISLDLPLKAIKECENAIIRHLSERFRYLHVDVSTKDNTAFVEMVWDCRKKRYVPFNCPERVTGELSDLKLNKE